MATAEREQKIASIRELPARLERVVAGLSDEQLDRPAGGEEWSVRQVVHHLADAHLNAFVRMKLVITEMKPILKPYNQEVWAELPDTTTLPVSPSLDILRGLHQRWSALLESLPEDSWSRQGIHLEAGLLTLDELLTTYAEHGEIHLHQIERIKAGLGS